MFRDSKRRPHQLRSIASWGLLFATVLVAVWAASRSRLAPHLILVALLYLITINFSAPLAHGGGSLVPVVSVSSLLVLGLPASAMLLAGCVLLAVFVAPLWEPLWDSIGISFSWKDRVADGLIYLVALSVAARIYRELGGEAPLVESTAGNLRSFIGLSAGYGLIYVIASLFFWYAQKRSWRQFPLLLTITSGLLAHPVSLLGAIVYAQNRAPAFVAYSMLLAGLAVIVWLSWQRSQLLQQRFSQLSILNQMGQSLRDTMDLETIVTKISQHVLTLIAADSLAINLVDESERWVRYQLSAPVETAPGSKVEGEQIPEPNDFVSWVARRSAVLKLHSGNLGFAEQHQIQIPEPTLTAWLGVPLSAGDRLIGVMSLESSSPGYRFDRWSQELLLAIAGQASSIIHNARLYGETVHLYDLTDAALSRRLKQLQALLDTMQEGVLMLDTHARIALINPVAAQLLGSEEVSKLGNEALTEGMALGIGFDAESFVTLISQLTSGRRRELTETVFHTSSKRDEERPRRHWQRIESPVVDESGELVGWLMIFRDVTEEVEVAEMRSDLTRMIVHDLRNPIATLSSAIELAQSRIAGSPPDREEASVQLSNASRVCSDMLDMVDSMMDLSRMEAGQDIVQAEAMHMPPLVEQTVNRLAPLADAKEIDINLDFPEDLPAVWADQELMRRVFINLLDNSLKFTPVGGKIEISLRVEPLEILEREPGLCCTIDDSGPGVPVHFRQQVFDRFTRTNPDGIQVKGAGLGLAFCRLVVEAHGGRIWIEDRATGGSHFIFVLPGVPRIE
jgi:PAS domain S-box-containing protein